MTISGKLGKIKKSANAFRQTFETTDAAWVNVFYRPLLHISWVTACLSLLIRRQVELDKGPEGATQLMSDYSFLNGIMSKLYSASIFYLAFYNSVGYSRWMANWVCTQTGYGRINDLNILVPAFMAHTPKLATDVLRFVNAYHHLTYFDILKHPVDESLEICVDRQLLTAEEVEVLKSQTCSKGMRILIWATQTIKNAPGLDSEERVQLNEMIVLLRRNMAYLWSYDDQLLPFAYVSSMNLLVFLVVLGTSFIVGLQGPNLLDKDESLDWGKVVVVVLANTFWCFFLLLLREVTILLADPWSAGRNGINAERYMDLLTAGTAKLVAYNNKPVDGKEDPHFVEMATKDGEEWMFVQRRKRDTSYLKDDKGKEQALRRSEYTRDLTTKPILMTQKQQKFRSGLTPGTPTETPKTPTGLTPPTPLTPETPKAKSNQQTI